MPGAPEIESVTTGTTSLTVAFKPPDDNGGQQITSYIVRVQPGEEEHTVTGSPAVIDNLMGGVAYQVAVAAVNPLGHGAFSPLSEPAVPGRCGEGRVGEVAL